MDKQEFEKIGNVKLNYQFYKGSDEYSDGDIEDRLLEIVRQEEPYEEVITRETDWALLYHLSPIRENLLEWYEFGKEKSVLEIGAGCGAVSGLLCRKCGRVAAIDLSRRRSLINAYRNRNAGNLEIFVGNFEDIHTEEKFDYVTLIGVLEYSIYYINSNSPFMDMLKKAREYLKPGGKLIVAIENKYGIKYWAGASEDHTGKAFDGITGYDGVDRVRTFSRKELEQLLKDAGFGDQEFYYPLPDYKLPLEVYSEKKLPKRYPISGNTPNYDRARMRLFNEEKAMNELIRDGMFEQFANSFLVICGQTENSNVKQKDSESGKQD